MSGMIALLAVAILLFMHRDHNKYETVYKGNETNLSEANEYYWLLKNHQIPFKYQMPYNWRNFYEFGYKESPVYIKVSEKDVERATQLMMFYRAEKLKMERHIASEKNRR